MIPEGLPHFDGWRPVGREEILDKDKCVWVKISGSMAAFPNQKFPNPGHEDSVITDHWHNKKLIDCGAFNPMWYVYRKVSYQGMPKGLVAEPGWFPLPDDVPMVESDRFFYGYKLTYQEKPANICMGKSMIDYCKYVGLATNNIAGWPHRYGQNFGYAAAPTRNRLPPNPAQLTAELPLP